LTELLQMLNMTTTGSHSHVGSSQSSVWWSSPPSCWCDLILWQLFPYISSMHWRTYV